MLSMLLYDYCSISLFAEMVLHLGQVPMLVYDKTELNPPAFPHVAPGRMGGKQLIVRKPSREGPHR